MPRARVEHPMSHAERGALGGKDAAERMTPEQRAERAAKASAAAATPLAKTRQLINAWERSDEDVREAQLPEIRRQLRAAGIIR